MDETNFTVATIGAECYSMLVILPSKFLTVDIPSRPGKTMRCGCVNYEWISGELRTANLNSWRNFINAWRSESEGNQRDCLHLSNPNLEAGDVLQNG